jgi:hypothetical protein
MHTTHASITHMHTHTYTRGGRMRNSMPRQAHMVQLHCKAEVGQLRDRAAGIAQEPNGLCEEHIRRFDVPAAVAGRAGATAAIWQQHATRNIRRATYGAQHTARNMPQSRYNRIVWGVRPSVRALRRLSYAQHVTAAYAVHGMLFAAPRRCACVHSGPGAPHGARQRSQPCALQLALHRHLCTMLSECR